jgi:lantibiotic modifying enzyme
MRKGLDVDQWEIATYIATQMLKGSAPERSSGFYSGLCGEAAFLACLDQNETYSTAILDRFDRAIALASDHGVEIDLSLGYGLTGLAYTAKMLISFGYVAEQDVEWIADVEDAIAQKLEDEQINPSIALGVAGWGTYLLVAPLTNLPLARRTVLALKLSAIRTRHGVRWDDMVGHSMTINTGIPHGVAGVLCYLTNTFSLGIESAISQELLLGACQELCFALFAAEKDGNQNTVGSHAVRWCFGDLPILYAFHVANGVLKSKEIESAIHVLRSRLCEHFSLAESDSNLCHGYSGVLLLLDRLSRLTKDTIYDNLANQCKVALISGFDPVNTKWGYLGFTDAGQDLATTENYGFLNGGSGIGITMLWPGERASKVLDTMFLLNQCHAD